MVRIKLPDGREAVGSSHRAIAALLRLKHYPVIGRGKVELDLYIAELKAKKRAEAILGVLVIVGLVGLCVAGILFSR